MLRKLLIFIGCVAALAMIVAACTRDDIPGVGDDTTDDVVQLDDDTVTPDATTPDTTPDATPDDATPDDATQDTTPEATPEDDDGTPTADGTPTDDDDGTPTADGTPTDDDDVDAERAQYTIIVTDDDIEIRNGDLLDDLGLTTISVSDGPVTFSVVNEGESAHTLVIERRDEDDDNDDATPTTGMTDDQMMQFEETLQPGETGTWEVNLQPGQYVLYSQEHRDDGVEIDFDVDEPDDN